MSHFTSLFFYNSSNSSSPFFTPLSPSTPSPYLVCLPARILAQLKAAPVIFAITIPLGVNAKANTCAYCPHCPHFLGHHTNRIFIGPSPNRSARSYSPDQMIPRFPFLLRRLYTL